LFIYRDLIGCSYCIDALSSTMEVLRHQRGIDFSIGCPRTLSSLQDYGDKRERDGKQRNADPEQILDSGMRNAMPIGVSGFRFRDRRKLPSVAQWFVDGPWRREVVLCVAHCTEIRRVGDPAALGVPLVQLAERFKAAVRPEYSKQRWSNIAILMLAGTSFTSASAAQE
jgi:hypothetical protein